MIPAELTNAILGRPDDDTPRLAAADWLDDYAADLPDPASARDRAELIRVQCRQAVLGSHLPHDIVDADAPSCEACVEYEAARSRAALLLSLRSREWFRDAIPGGRVCLSGPHTPEPFYVLPGLNNFVGVDVVRGFIGGVSLRSDAFAGDGVPCHYCADGPVSQETGLVECRQCDSTGFLCDPVAADLFRLHPITTVSLTDMGPARVVFGGPRRDRWQVPEGLRMLLRDGLKTFAPEQLWYETEAECYGAISAACVEYGRYLRANGARPTVVNYPGLWPTVVATRGGGHR